MEIIERYTSAAMKLDDLRREKARLKDEVIPAEVKQALSEIDEEFEPLEREAQKELEDAQVEVVKAVLERGQSIKGSTHMAVFRKPSVTWNTELLEKLSQKYPEIDLARKVGNPSVAIRLNK